MMKFKYKLPPHIERRYKPIMVYFDKNTLGLAELKAYCDFIPGSKAQIRSQRKNERRLKKIRRRLGR